jgi:hypothetical protein
MRGQTVSGGTEVLSFSGHKSGYAYRLVSFELYPSTGIGIARNELAATITAGKTAKPPADPNFNHEGLIGTALMTTYTSPAYPAAHWSVVNDMFLITQDLILMAQDADAGTPINWQCRFVSEKMSGPEAAAANYKQFAISDD